MATFGSVVLWIALVVATWSACASIVGARRRDRRLIDSGIHAAYGVMALMVLDSAVIIHAFVSNDYSIKYVQHYSDATMPLVYKITAYWGGLDGSLMFWVLILSVFSAIAIWRNRQRHRELIPWVTAVCMGVSVFFIEMLIFVKNPFDVFAGVAHPVEGKGLNPLLQNYWMQFHPPSLYTGFVSATIPFAFGMAALITGNLDDNWLKSVRVWAFVSWFFLAQGLTLGSMWAYEVLGWGGYWGWDPVENAGFLPWLTGTAFLHSIIIQERRGMLKVWNVLLVIITFLLTIFGTTMTRSGIVQSVHAFGQDNVLLTWFLIFLGVVIILSVALIIYRMPLLRSRSELESWVSREFAFVINNWVLLFAAFFILVATMFPTISEAVTGQRVTVGPPFFNQWMVPIGLILLALTGIGPLLAWRRTTAENLKFQFAVPLAVMLVAFTALTIVFYKKGVDLDFWAISCWSLCAFVLMSIGQEFWRGARVRQRTTKLDFFTSLIGLIGRSKRRYGGYLIHVAIVMLFFGWAGNAYQKTAEATLRSGETMHLGGFDVRFDRLNRTEDLQKESLDARVTVTRKGQVVSVSKMPGIELFKKAGDEGRMTIPSITRFLAGDLYLTLAGYDPQLGAANIKGFFNPLVDWYWLGFMMILIGTVICLAPDHAYSYAAARKGVAAATTTAAVILIILGSAHAVRAAPLQMPQTKVQQHQPTGQKPDMTKHEKALFKQMGCTCPCNKQPLSDCSCGIADDLRGGIRQQMAAGMSDDQILAAYAKAHGQDFLIIPRSAIVWALPYGAAALGLGLIVMLARKWTKKAPEPPREAKVASGPTSEYDERLDDELRDLD